MQKGMTLVEMATEIQRVESAKHDLVAPTTKLEMVTIDGEKAPELRIKVAGNGEYGIGNVAHEQIGDRLGIPRKYYERMRNEAPALLSTNVNTWFNKNPERRLVRTLDGNARAFLSDRFRPLDNALVAAATLPVLREMGDIEILSTKLTERRLYLQVITGRLEGEVKVGDVVRKGIVISNSEVGLGAVTVDDFIYRLVCKNGAIMSKAMRTYHVGKRIDTGDEVTAGYYAAETIAADNQAFLLKLRDTVKNAFSEQKFREDLEKMRAAAERRIEAKNISDAVVEVTKRFGLSMEEKDDVLKNLIEGGDLSAWGLSNAITAVANDEKVNYDRVVELERIGGSIIDLSPADWKVITG